MYKSEQQLIFLQKQNAINTNYKICFAYLEIRWLVEPGQSTVGAMLHPRLTKVQKDAARMALHQNMRLRKGTYT
jgi:hypothetical protein